MTILAGAEPFAHDGGATGVLLSHGFTGCPQSLRPWAQALADHGHTVRLPRLPGHGTTWQEMNRTTWPQWYRELETAFVELRERCERVVLCGLSMGGGLVLRLAEQRPDEVAGLVLVNPAVRLEDTRLRLLPVIRRIVPSLAGIGSDIAKPGVSELAYDRTPLHALASSLDLYQVVRADLTKVTAPLLLFRSATDHVVPASSSAQILAEVSSADRTEVICADSYHVATLDHDAPMIIEGSLAFIDRISQPSAATP